MEETFNLTLNLLNQFTYSNILYPLTTNLKGATMIALDFEDLTHCAILHCAVNHFVDFKKLTQQYHLQKER